MAAVKAAPEGFHSITPYVVAHGAGKLIDFVKQAFGAEEVFRMARPDGTIGHAEMRIGDSMVEMGDGTDGSKPMPVSLHLYVSDADAVYRRALEAGAASMHEPVDQEYGDREAGVKDPCGNHWYIATHKGAHYVPEGLRSVTPYLHPRGTAKLIDFLKRAFDAQEEARHEAPDGTVAHAKIRIGDSIVEMGEAHGQWGPMPATIHLYVSDTDAVYRQAMAAGAAKSLSEPADQPYGDRIAGVEDAFGNRWYIATQIGK
jgi:PhnB protein